MFRRVFQAPQGRRFFSDHAHHKTEREMYPGPPCFNGKPWTWREKTMVMLNAQMLFFYILSHYKVDYKPVDFTKEAEERILRKEQGKEVHFGSYYYQDRIRAEQREKEEAEHDEMVRRWKAGKD